MDEYKNYREFLKADLWKKRDTAESDMERGIKRPEAVKPAVESENIINLIAPAELKNNGLGKVDLFTVIEERKSKRSYSGEPFSKAELSFMLWATQGMKEGKLVRRNVPSGGARHPFETYLAVQNVTGIDSGIYRYLPVRHALIEIDKPAGLKEKMIAATRGQEFVGQANLLFIWAAIPYRSEWKYNYVAHKLIAIDGGHLGQNLYLTSEAVNGGTCAIAAYDQQLADELIKVDGEEEFAFYLAACGK